jgi:hypothetical protein
MRFMKRLLMGLAAVALAGTLLTLIAPKAVHAAVAALVEVANTSANPVPNADVNAPGEEPFQTVLCNNVGSLSCGVPDSFVVPATTSDGLSVKRLAIEYVSMNCANIGASGLQAILTTFTSANPVNGSAVSVIIPLPLTPISPGTSGVPVASLPMRAYADPGSTVVAGLGGSFSGSAGAVCSFNVIGRLITH